MKKITAITIFFVLLMISVVSLIVAIYALQGRIKTAPSSKAGDNDVQEVVKKIGSVMDLPEEKPTIITVTDREKLQGQEFFKKALNGDVVLLFETARRLILYRPSSGRIVDVAPLVLREQPPQSTTSAQVNTPIVQKQKTASTSSQPVEGVPITTTTPEAGPFRLNE